MKQILFPIDPETYKNEIVAEVVNQLSNGKSSPEPNSKLITRKEAAKYLKIGLSTLWKFTKEGKLKAYYMGNKVYYKLDEIEGALNTSKNSHI